MSNLCQSCNNVVEFKPKLAEHSIVENSKGFKKIGLTWKTKACKPS